MSQKSLIEKQSDIANDEKLVKETMQELENKGKEAVKELFTKNNITNNIIQKEISTILQKGSREFEEKIGRPMSYSELREMYG